MSIQSSAFTTSGIPIPIPIPASTSPLAVRVSEDSGDGRNHIKGALYGLGIGAVVGGVGLFLLDYGVSKSPPRNEDKSLALTFGAMLGGVAGTVAGAIIGAPKHRAPREGGLQLRVDPDLSRRFGFTASYALRLR